MNLDYTKLHRRMYSQNQ